MELTDLEDAAAVAVYADQLEERGDPRSELLHVQLDELPGAALVAAHWESWVGALSPERTLLRWRRGFVVEAALHGTPEGWRLSDFLRRPAMGFLRRLSLGRDVVFDFSELRDAAALRELVWLAGKRGSPARLELPLLERLTVDLQVNGLAALSTAHLPGLRHLDTGCPPEDEAALLDALADASFWPTLASWTHRVRTPEGLLALATCPPLLARAGRGLRVMCDAAALAHLTPQQRQLFPKASFELRPRPAVPRDPEDLHRPADISVTPRSAPMHFRQLPGWQVKATRSTQSAHDTDTVKVGPGVPFAELSWRADSFSRCGWCGSEDTRCIQTSDWYSYSHFETTTYARWEYECLACGLFTNTGSQRTR